MNLCTSENIKRYLSSFVVVVVVVVVVVEVYAICAIAELCSVPILVTSD